MPCREIAASPVHHVRPGMALATILHGTVDSTVPLKASNAEAKMCEAGNRCELTAYEGEAQGFFNWSRNINVYVDAAERADRFLQELGLL